MTERTITSDVITCPKCYSPNAKTKHPEEMTMLYCCMSCGTTYTVYSYIVSECVEVKSTEIKEAE